MKQIPRNLFQTWSTKQLPPKLKERVDHLRAVNPEYHYQLFDDSDCRSFIQTHFGNEVVAAYDCLVPGAYKADLWRLCVLYVHGGVYMDIKLDCINGFRLSHLDPTKNHFVRDRPMPLSIYNAFMMCFAGHPFLRMGIYRIVTNVHHHFYGRSPLAPTGPEMLGMIVLRRKVSINLDLVHSPHGGEIWQNGRAILSTEYPEYDRDRRESNPVKRYDQLWNERKIYKTH